MTPRPRALLLDLDDTLYDYAPAEAAARAAVLADVGAATGLAPDDCARRWDAARASVKARLGDRAAAHSRALYLSELLHAAGAASALRGVRAWEARYWAVFSDAARLRPGALPLLRGWRARGHRVAIVTDLTLDVQLAKIERFGLWPLVDALVASEEVPWDKPAPEAFRLAIARLGVEASSCVVVGDSARRDGGGAAALGIPYLRVAAGERPAEGLSLEAVARALEAEP